MRTGILVSLTIRGFYFWICISSSCLLALYTHWILPTDSEMTSIRLCDDWNRSTNWEKTTHIHTKCSPSCTFAAHKAHTSNHYSSTVPFFVLFAQTAPIQPILWLFADKCQLWIRIFTGKLWALDVIEQRFGRFLQLLCNPSIFPSFFSRTKLRCCSTQNRQREEQKQKQERKYARRIENYSLNCARFSVAAAGLFGYRGEVYT